MKTPAEEIKALAESLASRALTLGYVVTIEPEPLRPLAMGNYRLAVNVRPVNRRPQEAEL